jgi:hypothetical protein
MYIISVSEGIKNEKYMTEKKHPINSKEHNYSVLLCQTVS